MDVEPSLTSSTTAGLGPSFEPCDEKLSLHLGRSRTTALGDKFRFRSVTDMTRQLVKLTNEAVYNVMVLDGQCDAHAVWIPIHEAASVIDFARTSGWSRDSVTGRRVMAHVEDSLAVAHSSLMSEIHRCQDCMPRDTQSSRSCAGTGVGPISHPQTLPLSEKEAMKSILGDHVQENVVNSSWQARSKAQSQCGLVVQRAFQLSELCVKANLLHRVTHDRAGLDDADDAIEVALELLDDIDPSDAEEIAKLTRQIQDSHEYVSLARERFLRDVDVGQRSHASTPRPTSPSSTAAMLRGT